MSRKQKSDYRWVVTAVVLIVVIVFGIAKKHGEKNESKPVELGDSAEYYSLTAESFPEYYGQPYIEVNGGKAYFDASDITTEPFEIYSELDELGRCGAAYANICTELMPTGERGSISSIKPTGWHSVKYDIVDGGSLYNRSHLIGFQLAGENANERNLITGTRFFNAETMLQFEDEVAGYVHETDNHVLYRVTPYFEGDNLVAKGVMMEAYSVEDEGSGVSFNVFCYNVQPGIEIDYATGDSREVD